jgi:para-aminobenzoate synthetase component I
MLNWASQFNIFLLLPANGYNQQGVHNFEILLGAGAKHTFTASNTSANMFAEWQHFIDTHNTSFILGNINYDVKEHIEQLYSTKENAIGFDKLHWFVPENIIIYHDGILYIQGNGNNEGLIFDDIMNATVDTNVVAPKLNIRHVMSKSEYVHAVTQLQKHISRGDCYEVNYCQCFEAKGAKINPIETFLKLNSVSPNPFAACYKVNQQYMLCASPERYITINKGMLYSQPIKGTAKRILDDAAADEQLKNSLQQHYKERAENIMVVDLVRNDMSRVCESGTVVVDELCAIYSYPQVHQMISTIKGKIKTGVNFTDIIKATFPMGSMTGAPKYRVMQLIDELEYTKRGLFSGSVGFISPNGHVDLNVVIRSIMYDNEEEYLNFHTGSAITFYSNAQEEYEECMLKAKAIMQVLQ